MPVIHGTITPKMSIPSLLFKWQSRRDVEIAPQVDLETDGERFQLTYSQSWPVIGLQHAFQLVVSQIAPNAIVNWQSDTTEIKEIYHDDDARH